MSIAIIAAMARNGVIGNSKMSKLPWVVPEELGFFRKETMGKVIVMGRKTAESVGALDGRRCVVMSTKMNYRLNGFETMRHSEIIKLSYSNQVMICGGAEIYNLFMQDANEAIISELDLEAHGDIFMPKLPKGFKMVRTEHFSRFTVVRRIRHD